MAPEKALQLSAACLAGMLGTVAFFQLYRSVPQEEAPPSADQDAHKGDIHKHCAQKIATERNGRINAEKALRQGVVEKISQVGYPLFVIGTVRSPYLGRRGTPRQGLLVPDSLASIQLSNDIPTETLLGLDGYSHMFVQFLFHENTNLPKTVLASSQSAQAGLKARAASSKSATFTSKVSSFASKVLPPLLNGGSIGVFATRSPHRPNALGLSLVRVVSVNVEERTVQVAGADLVNGTPVVDLKPWGPFDCPTCFHATVDHEGIIPRCTSIEDRCSLFTVRIPDWVNAGLSHPYTLPIEWSHDARHQLQSLVDTKQTQYYNGPDDTPLLQRAITQMLALDIRSNHRGRGKGPQAKPNRGPDQIAVAEDMVSNGLNAELTSVEQAYELEFDTLHISFVVRKDDRHDGGPWILVDNVELVQTIN
ncbi:TsaA-like domain-containing protein [Powellomyces hirtus]|nr:TsaA-like domain-containing protein [Powellomyces hirtus]